MSDKDVAFDEAASNEERIAAVNRIIRRHTFAEMPASAVAVDYARFVCERMEALRDSLQRRQDQ